MTIEEAKEWVEKQHWKYAKSYSKTFPHYYTTRDIVTDTFEFEQFLWVIRDFGKLKSFYSKQYIYLELGNYEYWEMGRPVKAVQVLNKALIDDHANYRKYKPTKEEENMLKAKMNKRDMYLNCLHNKQVRNFKEEKHYRFLMNNTRRIHGGGQNIIDHSNQPIRYE